MINKYQVKIDDEILPKLLSFDEMIEAGLLDDFDENIKIRQSGEDEWVIARDYPFAQVESDVETNNQLKDTGSSSYSTNQIGVTTPPPFHQPIHYPSNVTHCWNWGAFCFSWFWGVLNGLYWPLVIIALNFIPYAGVFIYLGVSIFLGHKGNHLAWNVAKRNGISLPSFTKLQARWNRAGICFFVFMLFVSLCYIVFTLI